MGRVNERKELPKIASDQVANDPHNIFYKNDKKELLIHNLCAPSSNKKIYKKKKKE
jgi:hypothetical protein